MKIVQTVLILAYYLPVLFTGVLSRGGGIGSALHILVNIPQLKGRKFLELQELMRG